MSVLLGSGNWLRLLNAAWLNGINAFSFGCWVSIPTITTAQKNYVWSHRGAVNQISLRKDSTSDRFRFSVTCGGVAITRDSASTVVAAGAKYFVSGDWAANVATTGMRIFINGVQEQQTGTTTQTGPYDSGASTTPLLIGAKNETAPEELLGSVGGLWIVLGRQIKAAQHLAAYEAGWPFLAGLDADLYLPLDGGDRLTKFPDMSRSARHIVLPGGLQGTVAVGVPMGRGGPAKRKSASSRSVKAASVAPPPLPTGWTTAGIVAHPQTTIAILGLDPEKSYEVRVTARRTVLGGVVSSAPSGSVQARPLGTTIKHVPKKVLIG